MKRSSFITWDQLKVGAVIVVAIIVVGVAIYKLGQTANLFSKRYRLTAFLKEANGLREGGPVMVAGQLAGTIRSIEFLAVDNDTTRNLRVILEIDAGLREQIRSDSRARVRTMGLLGDKMIDITPGTPRYGILAANDTIVVAPSVDFEAVLAMAAGATDDVVGLTQDLRQITARLVSGEGTVGQLLTNPRMYDEMAGTLARTNALLVRVQQSNGTVGRCRWTAVAVYSRSSAASATVMS